MKKQHPAQVTVFWLIEFEHLHYYFTFSGGEEGEEGEGGYF